MGVSLANINSKQRGLCQEPPGTLCLGWGRGGALSVEEAPGRAPLLSGAAARLRAVLLACRPPIWGSAREVWPCPLVGHLNRHLCQAPRTPSGHLSAREAAWGCVPWWAGVETGRAGHVRGAGRAGHVRGALHSRF